MSERRSPPASNGGMITIAGTVRPGPAGTIIFENDRARVFLDKRLVIVGEDQRSVTLPAKMAREKGLQ